jgi:putative ABC transport system permease protein
MIRNYLKTAWRNMLRNKTSSFINISGLSIGTACALLIVIFIKNELSYDRFIKMPSRIFQVVLNGNMNGRNSGPAIHRHPLEPHLRTIFRKLKLTQGFISQGIWLFACEEKGIPDKFFTEKNVLAVDFKFFAGFRF